MLERFRQQEFNGKIENVREYGAEYKGEIQWHTAQEWSDIAYYETGKRVNAKTIHKRASLVRNGHKNYTNRQIVALDKLNGYNLAARKKKQKESRQKKEQREVSMLAQFLRSRLV